MLISRAWLESLLTPPEGDRMSDAALGEAITSLGLEVESITEVGQGLHTVIVGRVEAIEPHPKADKLRVVKLFDGQGVRTVVCGAPNVPEPGGKVAFAPLGSVLPGDFRIEPREIRGVGSEGMICAEDELQIGPDSDGILVLPSGWLAGDRLIDRVPGIVDTIYELGITPNRPDALGHMGVARDLAVKLGQRLRPRKERLEEVPDVAGLVALQAPERCGRYLGRIFEGVEVGPSPLWLRVRLHRMGLRPINNVVDITNLVLLEWGQPMHAFDRDQLREGRVVVRLAHPGEPMVTLDGQELQLDPDDLVIADADRAQALAGVMGGAGSGVTQSASRLLLEVAWFAPSPVRRSARRHQLSTDSSYRFERGVGHGPNLVGAAARASTLIQELTGAECVGGLNVFGDVPLQPEIALRPARATLLLGMDVPDDESIRILEGLGVELDTSDPGQWLCKPPTHRPDLTREEDLIEEIMRHHGLEALPAVPMVPTTAPRTSISPEQRVAEAAFELEWSVIEALREAGLHEHISLAFSGVEDLEPFADVVPVDRAVALRNPLRSQASHLRTHMLPGLLKALAPNINRHGQPVRLFEFGRTYAWPAPGDDGPVHADATADIDRTLAHEQRRAAVLMSPGRSGQPIDARSVGTALLTVLARLGATARVVPSASAVPWLHPGVQASVVVTAPQGEREVGRFGEVHPDLGRAYALEEARAFYGELWLEALPAPAVSRYFAVPRFPSSARDLSLDLDQTVPAATVVALLTEAAPAPVGDDPPTLVAPSRITPAIELVEDYRGKGIEPGRKALLLRLHYAAAERSVTDTEVQTLHDAIVQGALGKLGALDPQAKVR